MPICKEVISSIKTKVVDKQKGKLQNIIAAAMMASVEPEKPEKPESDFASEIASYFAPVLLASEDNVQ